MTINYLYLLEVALVVRYGSMKTNAILNGGQVFAEMAWFDPPALERHCRQWLSKQILHYTNPCSILGAPAFTSWIACWDVYFFDLMKLPSLKRVTWEWVMVRPPLSKPKGRNSSPLTLLARWANQFELYQLDCPLDNSSSGRRANSCCSRVAILGAPGSQESPRYPTGPVLLSNDYADFQHPKNCQGIPRGGGRLAK